MYASPFLSLAIRQPLSARRTAIPNLYAVQTLTSAKAATALDKALPSPAVRPEPLRVLLQVNTSGEDAKSGLPPLSLPADAAAEDEADVDAAHALALDDLDELAGAHLADLDELRGEEEQVLAAVGVRRRLGLPTDVPRRARRDAKAGRVAAVLCKCTHRETVSRES